MCMVGTRDFFIFRLVSLKAWISNQRHTFKPTPQEEMNRHKHPLTRPGMRFLHSTVLHDRSCSAGCSQRELVRSFAAGRYSPQLCFTRKTNNTPHLSFNFDTPCYIFNAHTQDSRMFCHCTWTSSPSTRTCVSFSLAARSRLWRF